MNSICIIVDMVALQSADSYRFFDIYPMYYISCLVG